MSEKEFHKSEKVKSVEKVLTRMKNHLAGMDDHLINRIPYEGSWTAAQVFDHVTKSINGLSGSLKKPSVPAGRDVEARIPELEKVFLDFSHKLKSPDFILPGKGPFEKQQVLDNLNAAFEHLKENSADADMEDLVEGLPLGPITKLEILHFLRIHAERHVHQMEKISKALRS
jgi:hypothetical protein